MLAERNENKRLAELPATKLHVLPKNSKRLQKENKLPINNPQPTFQPAKQHIEPVTEDPQKNLLVVETNKIKTFNLKKILSFELSKSKDNYRSDFLQRHKISADIRTRMVN